MYSAKGTVSVATTALMRKTFPVLAYWLMSTGAVAGFADATGRQLPLVCTLNGAPVLAAVATMLGVDFDEMDRLALTSPPGAEGLTLHF